MNRIPERLLVVPALVAVLLGMAVGAATAGGGSSATVDGSIGVDGGGRAVVTGTYRCGSGSLSLTVLVSEGEPEFARGQVPLSLPCDGSTRPWTVTVAPYSGRYRPRATGSATLAASGVSPNPTPVRYAALL